MSLLDKLGKFEKSDTQEEKKQIKIQDKKEIKKIAPEPKKKIYSLIEPISDYKPHGTDIMASYRLISGKSIRKYKGKGTNEALLDGLIQACLNLKSKLNK